MISPSDPIEAIRSQRRTESPGFWMIVFAASLLIHLVLVLGIRSLLMQAIRVPVEPEPISVEFAEATDEAPSPLPEQPKQAASQAVPSNQTPAAPEAKSVASPVETPSTTLQTPAPTPESAPLPIPQPTRPIQRSSLPASPAASRPNVVPPPTSSPTPDQIPNRVTSPNSASSSLKTQLSNPATRGPIASGIRLPDVPNVPNPADNPGRTAGSSNLPTNPLAIAKAPTPAKFLAQVRVLPAVDKGASDRSAASTPVTIQGETSKEFTSDASSCLLNPEALSAFGKTVVLSVLLDEQGQLQGEPTVVDQSSSSNSRYEELAACVLKQWTFSPAHDEAGGNTSSKPTTIQVQVKITATLGMEN